MSIRRTAVAATTMLTVLALSARAQQESAQLESEAELRTVLRAFYFNLAHRDWEAIAADVLSAKVVASRAAPISVTETPRDHPRAACSSSLPAEVARAAIRLEGDWAGVSVPRCGVPHGADEFRLIHFERRWRFVYIDLFEQPMLVSVDR